MAIRFQHSAAQSTLNTITLKKSSYRIAALSVAVLALVACSDSGSEDTTTSDTSTPDSGDEQVTNDKFNPELMDPVGLLGEITIVDCTLSGGTETTCYQVVTNG